MPKNIVFCDNHGSMAQKNFFADMLRKVHNDGHSTKNSAHIVEFPSNSDKTQPEENNQDTSLSIIDIVQGGIVKTRLLEAIKQLLDQDIAFTYLRTYKESLDTENTLNNQELLDRMSNLNKFSQEELNLARQELTINQTLFNNIIGLDSIKEFDDQVMFVRFKSAHLESSGLGMTLVGFVHCLSWSKSIKQDKDLDPNDFIFIYPISNVKEVISCESLTGKNLEACPLVSQFYSFYSEVIEEKSYDSMIRCSIEGNSSLPDCETLIASMYPQPAQNKNEPLLHTEL